MTVHGFLHSTILFVLMYYNIYIYSQYSRVKRESGCLSRGQIYTFSSCELHPIYEWCSIRSCVSESVRYYSYYALGVVIPDRLVLQHKRAQRFTVSKLLACVPSPKTYTRYILYRLRNPRLKLLPVRPVYLAAIIYFS